MDGVIEAIEAASHPFWLGVQWHPEFLYRKDVLQKRLFSAFVKAARHYASN
jgi:gamma-glutamyl-gamma-aminobutyrate hydrolase PuuD